jgi:hypothetical protein
MVPKQVLGQRILRENVREILEEYQFEGQWEILGGSHRHKIDYSHVAEKNRCARRNRLICLILNEL